MKKTCLKHRTKLFSSHPFTFHYSLFVFFFFFSLLLFLLSLTLIGIIYCLNYTSSLLHLVTTLLSHLFLSSIIFIISALIIGIFYCLNYTLLLLSLIIRDFVIDFLITISNSFSSDNEQSCWTFDFGSYRSSYTTLF